MSAFEATHRKAVVGTLAMFDRLIFRGHLNRFFAPGGIKAFLWGQGVPLTEFAGWAKQATTVLCQHAEAMAAQAGRPCLYLERQMTAATGQSKEDLARQIAARDGVTEGLVCVLRTLEPCTSFRLRRNHDTHQLEVVPGKRACLQLYFYFGLFCCFRGSLQTP